MGTQNKQFLKPSSPESRLRPYIAFAIIAIMAILAFIYYFFDPAETYWMPHCLWKTATGTDCPGCGSQRMAHALMHADIRKAWESNAFAFCMIPVVILYSWLEINVSRHPNIYRRLHSPWIINLFISSIIIWWLLRNIL